MLPPDVPIVTAPALTLYVPMAKVPPLTVSAAVLLPNAASLPAVNVPALTVVPPLKVLAPVRVQVPAPSLTSAPVVVPMMLATLPP